MINLKYHVDLVKWCIKTHNIKDFLVFEPNFDRVSAPTYGTIAADFWLDVVESLIADSLSESIEKPTTVSPSSVYKLGGKFYTQEQYQNILRIFYS